MTRDIRIMHLVSRETLAERALCVADIFAGLEELHSAGIDDPDALAAFRNYLLFRDPTAIVRAGLEPLNKEEQFYNKLYWFLSFARLCESLHGFDAGLRQQAFQLIEHAECEVDWSVVQQIYEYAGIEP